MKPAKTLLFLALLTVRTAAFAQGDKGTIQGRVYNPAGKPAASVRVVALELPNAKGLFWAYPVSVGTTDIEGRYRLSDLPMGRYRIFPHIRYADDLSSHELDAAPVVTVRSGASAVYDISLRESQGLMVSGRARANPTDAHFHTVTLNGRGVYRRRDVTLDGSFAFQDISPGTYRLMLDSAHLLWTSREIRVEDQDVTGVELFADDPIPVTGRVVTEGGGPVPAFELLLEGPKGFARAGIWTTDSVRSVSNYSAPGWSDRPDDVIFTSSLPIGEYRISVTGLPPGYRVKSFTYGETDLLERPLILSGQIGQFSIVLSAPESLVLTKLRGRVIRDVSLPPEFQLERVILKSDLLFTPLETLIERDGSFEIPDVPPGLYRVVSPDPGLRLIVGNRGVSGVEFRASEVRSHYEYYMREFNTPPLQPETDAGRQIELRGRIDVEDGATVYGSLLLKSTTGRESIIDFHDATLRGSVAEGEYTVGLILGEGYQLRSITYGSVDLRKEPLRIVENSDETLVLVITRTPPMSTGESSADRAGVRDTSIEQVDVPLAKTTVHGRILVEGGYPLPPVALTVRPNIDAGPPFVAPYTVRSGVRNSGFVVQRDGRFTVELPEGRHRLRADAYPESVYRVKSIRYGSRNLNQSLLEVDGNDLKELVITFSARSTIRWPKVRGRIDGLDLIPQPIHVVLTSRQKNFRFEAVPKADGTFEFPKIPPDTYTVLTAPRVSAMAPKPLVVADRDVSSLNLEIPARRTVIMRITPERESTQRINLSLSLSPTEAYTILLPLALVLRSANEWECISDVCSNSFERAAGEPAVLSSLPNDGTYVLALPEGEYRVEAQVLSPEYEVQSITYGSVDLRAEPLRVGLHSLQEIVVNLRRR